MIRFDIPDAEYRAWDGYNQSFLKTVILRSPAHAMADKYKSTDAMTEGKAFHTALLERKLFSQRVYVAKQVTRKRGTALDKKTGELKKLPWDHVLERANGKDIIWRTQAVNINRMIKSIRRHPMTAHLLSKPYQTEVSFKWKDTDTGLTCKGRADMVIQSENIIIDPKRTNDASKNGFRNTVSRFCYEMQVAFYIDALETLTGEPWMFLFLAAEPNPPYGVGLYELDHESINQGRTLYKQALELCKQCAEKNYWPAYSDVIEQINISTGNRFKAENVIDATHLEPEELEIPL